MKRAIVVSATLTAGLLVSGALLVSRTQVSPHDIERSVSRQPELVGRAWQLPVAATFERKINWQSNGSRCGPAAVANAYRSLKDKAATERDVLAGTGWCWTGVCIMGLTLDELAAVATANSNRKVKILRDLTEEEFREHMRRSNDADHRYIINFDRAKIFGSGVGHHSPIGGYLEAEDLVFVLDVNSDYQPWLVERSRLFTAMDTFDGSKRRGLLLIE
ncbi:MAG: phytochelatin synthase family protein [Hyphomicrobium sp.]